MSPCEEGSLTCWSDDCCNATRVYEVRWFVVHGGLLIALQNMWYLLQLYSYIQCSSKTIKENVLSNLDQRSPRSLLPSIDGRGAVTQGLL